MSEWAKNAGLATDYDARVATLDADPSSGYTDVYLSLGCLDAVPTGWLTPYTSELSPGIDTFTVGILDLGTDKFVDDISNQPAIRTDDESGLVIVNRAVLSGVTRLLLKGAGGLPQRQVLTAGMWQAGVDGTGVWSDFDADGFQDALDYLGCF